MMRAAGCAMAAILRPPAIGGFRPFPAGKTLEARLREIEWQVKAGQELKRGRPYGLTAGADDLC